MGGWQEATGAILLSVLGALQQAQVPAPAPACCPLPPPLCSYALSYVAHFVCIISAAPSRLPPCFKVLPSSMPLPASIVCYFLASNAHLMKHSNAGGVYRAVPGSFGCAGWTGVGGGPRQRPAVIGGAGGVVRCACLTPRINLHLAAADKLPSSFGRRPPHTPAQLAQAAPAAAADAGLPAATWQTCLTRTAASMHLTMITLCHILHCFCFRCMVMLHFLCRCSIVCSAHSVVLSTQVFVGGCLMPAVAYQTAQ